MKVHIDSIGPFSQDNMVVSVRKASHVLGFSPFTWFQDYAMDMHLQLFWEDMRLNLRQFGVNRTLSLNGADIVPRMWKPDLFFANVKTGSLHDVTMANQLVDISPDGHVFYSVR